MRLGDVHGSDRWVTRFDPGPDLRAARVVAALRLGALVAIAAVGSFAHGVAGGTEAFYLLVGLVALPWAIVVLFGTDTHGRAVARTGWVGDLAVAFALQVLVPDRARLALVVSVSVVVVTAYVVRLVAAWTLGTVAVALVVAGQLVAPRANRVGAGELALYVLVVVALSLVAERVSGERRRAAAWVTHLEGRAAAILDNVASAVVLTDTAGVVRSANPAAYRLVGTALAPGAHCSAVLALHDGERALDCADGCALLSAGSSDAVQLWRPLPGGRRQPVLANAAIVGGPVPEIVHSLGDVTKLLEADEAKTLFLATASHELKTPLTVINGFASTLLRNPDVPVETRMTALRAIHQRGQELAKIVDRLLMSSRIEAGRLRLEPHDIDVAAIVTERVSAVRLATGGDVRLDAPTAATAWAATDAVATVVDHLLDNALKYSPDGGAVDVDVVADEAGVRIRVRDRGIGMTAEQVERCFEKFWQGDASDARAYGGTGIGLYIVRSLVDAMHGDIRVVSEPGAGTEFEVRLPARAVVPPQRQDELATEGETSMIREFMRQIGVGEGTR